MYIKGFVPSINIPESIFHLKVFVILMTLLLSQLFFPPPVTVVMLNVLPLARNLSTFNLFVGEEE